MIEHYDPEDPAHRVRCQTYSHLGAPCVRYQDHGGYHLYDRQRARNQPAAQTPSSELPELSEGV